MKISALLFKQGVGVSLGQSLKHLRMRRARWLLDPPGLTVTEGRLEMGVTDESHFRRDFKKRFSVSPDGDRAAARGATAAAAGDDEPA
jgi:transcriptional regulator GlxA family with amidase domain